MAAPSGARRKTGRKSTNLTVDQVKNEFLRFFSQGSNIDQALTSVDRSRTTYEKWRREDADFVAQVERVRTIRNTGRPDGERVQMEFPEFSEKFLGQRVFPHMQNVVDMIEGRQPSWTHEAMTHVEGEPDLIMVNMPPEHAKTSTVTINYIVYRICMDPNVQAIIVSKTQAMARKMLYAIKTRLTHPRYAAMIAAYAPSGGFDKDAEAWNQDMIYVSDSARDSGEKDPTVQALGIRGHIYGARAHLVVADDCVDLTNAHEYEKQIDWIQSEVLSRIANSGAMMVLGTRLSSKDLYSELRDPHRYPDEVSPWSYLAMPAVLEYGDEEADWVTLWPRTDTPEVGAKGAALEPGVDGLFPKWDGPRLSKKRRRVSARAWAMVYMQKQVADDAIFDSDAVSHAINGNRLTGPIPKGMVGCRPNGMDGLIVVAGMDPATSGCTAAVCIAFDPLSQKRFVLDVYNKAGTTPEGIRDLIKMWTDKYSITEWRIEKNGFQGFLVHDREINEYCNARGTQVRPHFTGNNKHDADFGVASMTTLFSGWKDGMALVELPSSARSEAVKTLVEQLVTWAPNMPKQVKTDTVMAFWFAELACRDRVKSLGAFTRNHVKNPFLTPWDRSQQTTVNLLDAEANHSWRPIGV